MSVVQFILLGVTIGFPICVFLYVRKKFAKRDDAMRWSQMVASTSLAVAFLGVPYLAFTLNQQVVAQEEEADRNAHMDSLTISNDIVRNVQQGLELLSTDMRHLRYVSFTVDTSGRDPIWEEFTGVEAVRAFCQDLEIVADPLELLRRPFFIDMYYTIARCETLMRWAQAGALVDYQSYNLVQSVAFLYTPKFRPSMDLFCRSCEQRGVLERFPDTEAGRMNRWFVEMLINGHKKIVKAIEEYQV